MAYGGLCEQHGPYYGEWCDRCGMPHELLGVPEEPCPDCEEPCPDCDGDGYIDIVDGMGGVVGPAPCPRGCHPRGPDA